MNEERENPSVRYEKKDWELWAVLAGVGAVLGLLLIGHLLSWGFEKWFTWKGGRAELAPPARGRVWTPPPEPRLQVNPTADWSEMLAQENAWLNGYGWIDRGHGLIHIPIEQAITLTAEQGLPARPARPSEGSR